MVNAPSFLSGVFCCDCGHQTTCGWLDLNIGKVVQCESCSGVFVHLAGKYSGDAWYGLDPKEVESNGLLKKSTPEEDT